MLRKSTLSEKTRLMIEHSPKDHIGAEFGKFCMGMGYTVREVAEAFKVTPPTVYSWFRGKFVPKGDVAVKMRSLMDRVRKDPPPETTTTDE